MGRAFLFIMVCALLMLASAALTYVVVMRPFHNDFAITAALGGNLFPSAILSVATTDGEIVEPIDTPYVGNPKSGIGIKLRAPRHNARVEVELDETPYYARSVSSFVLPHKGVEYTIYPDILWRYEALRNNEQAAPISVAAEVRIDGREGMRHVRTFSVRSINECLIGYMQPLAGGKQRFVSTRLLFAAYVNEENPLIDQLLREALNTRIVRRFTGYQTGGAEQVDRQVYALWYALQKRKFQYSSVSYSSLSSNMVYSQRVRTFDDALSTSQINCVDGSVLFASLLRAINITPVLVQVPGHMFVGYYTDSRQRNLAFLETTMIGDVDLADYFPDEQIDSTASTKSQSEMSRLTFEKSKEYALGKFRQNESHVRNNEKGYLFVEISKAVRRKVQSIGR